MVHSGTYHYTYIYIIIFIIARIRGVYTHATDRREQEWAEVAPPKCSSAIQYYSYLVLKLRLLSKGTFTKPPASLHFPAIEQCRISRPCD